MQFGILGPLEVRHEGRQLRIGGAKERALLAILLLNAGEPVSVDRLIDELWSDTPPRTARKSLQVRVAGLRRSIGDDVLLTSGDAYVVRPEQHDLDLLRFERLLADGSDALAAHDAARSVEILTEGLALWRGRPLADFAYESFAQPAITRLEELRVHALELLVDARLELGRHDAVIAELEALVRAYPFRERLRGQLMLALYRAGRQAEALDVFRRARAELVDELGIEPGHALRSLEQAILRADPSLELAAPERSILVAPRDAQQLATLVALAEALAMRPRRELILAWLVRDAAELNAAAALANERRDVLLERGVAARAITFTSLAAGDDLARIATEQDVDLLLLSGRPDLEDVEAVLARAPCDVAVHVAREEEPPRGAVFALFAGSDHDWSAVEVAAWIAGATGVPLRLAGPAEGAERDASRALASASLAVQRVFGIAAEPVLLPPSASHVAAAADDAALVVIGLPEGWRRDGLGKVRGALASEARAPALLVRRGLRPGGLAPSESLTRFTWTLAPG